MTYLDFINYILDVTCKYDNRIREGVNKESLDDWRMDVDLLQVRLFNSASMDVDRNVTKVCVGRRNISVAHNNKMRSKQTSLNPGCSVIQRVWFSLSPKHC